MNDKTRYKQQLPPPPEPVLPRAELLRITTDPVQFFRAYLGHQCRNDFNDMHQFSFAQYRRRTPSPSPCALSGLSPSPHPGELPSLPSTPCCFPIMDILSGRECHQVIISGTMQQAKNSLATIARELRTNPQSATPSSAGRIPRFKSNSRYIGLGKCRIEAFSAGSARRGVP